MTLKDVAQRAGCSVATVSKALKNSAEISSEAKERILAAAEEVGYLKKANNRGLMLGGIKTVVFSGEGDKNFEAYARLLSVAKSKGITLIYAPIGPKKAAELMGQLGALGVVVPSSDGTVIDGRRLTFGGDVGLAGRFFAELIEYVVPRASRSSATKGTADLKKIKEIKKPSVQKSEEPPKATPKKQEEIWLL